MKTFPMPTPVPGARKYSGMFTFLLIITVSYWYCLPVTTQSFFQYSEIRGYDFLLLLLTIVLITKHKKRLKAFLRRDEPGRWIVRFSIWATLTCVITFWVAFSYGRPIWSLVTGVFLFHLWGFAFAYAALRMFVTTRRQCFMLLDVFLLLGALQGLIICLQGMGFLPLFWSDLYGAYGDDAFSGTLGPNRALPGHTMLLVFGVAASYWRNARTVGVSRLCMATCAAVVSIAALGLSGSRTSWVALAAFCVAAVFAQRPQPGFLAFILVIVLGIAFVIPDSIEEKVTKIYDGRVGSKLGVAKDETMVAKLQALDSRRWKNWTSGLSELYSQPWLVPFGGGFNNYRFMMKVDISAHNIYITLVAEVGLVGLFLYLMWLRGIWRESSRLMAVANKVKRRRKNIFLPVDMRALLIAMLVALFAGELLYPYRPAFAFMGMFLFLCAIMNSPLLVLGDPRSSFLLSRQNIRAINQKFNGREAA
jgi:O-antigen ligase